MRHVRVMSMNEQSLTAETMRQRKIALVVVQAHTPPVRFIVDLLARDAASYKRPLFSDSVSVSVCVSASVCLSAARLVL